MLHYILIVSVFILTLLIFSKKKHERRIPGLKRSDKVYGNIADIASAGSFPTFLKQLHDKYGPIASYWHMDVYTVSISDYKYFKHTEKMFDRHPSLFQVIIR